MATDSRDASGPPGVARLGLSTDRAEPVPLVWTSADLLSRSALDQVGSATDASGKVRSLSVAEGTGV